MDISVSPRGVATLTFNRPERANSYDAAMLDALADAFERFAADKSVRVIILRGAGKHFSAGAAIGAAGKPRRGIGEVCALVDAVPKPTIAVVQGACIGGALALASCCDVMLATPDAIFAIPEVRLGFAPGPLIPVFARAVGIRALRRYLLSGERFAAEDALRLGLVHALATAEELETILDETIDGCLLAAPSAVTRAKYQLRNYATPRVNADDLRELQKTYESLSNSEEAMEGRNAFKEKRKPRWYPPA
jgi:methylglutaconyl-CoA hydratase